MTITTVTLSNIRETLEVPDTPVTPGKRVRD